MFIINILYFTFTTLQRLSAHPGTPSSYSSGNIRLHQIQIVCHYMYLESLILICAIYILTSNIPYTFFIKTQIIFF